MTPKTKDAKKVLSALGVEGKALVVVDIDDTNTIKSFLNLPEVQLIESRELNAYDVLCSDYVIFSHATLPGGGEVTLAAAGQEGCCQEGCACQEGRCQGRGKSLRRSPRRPMLPKDASAADRRRRRQARCPQALTLRSRPAMLREGYEIKGNASSMLYHVPGSAFYDRTVAEILVRDRRRRRGCRLPAAP